MHLKKCTNVCHNERGIKQVENKKAFIFSTCGVYGENKMIKDHTALREILISKGYEILGEFSCKGLDTNSVLKFIGGLNKKHPDAVDLQNATDFARNLGATT